MLQFVINKKTYDFKFSIRFARMLDEAQSIQSNGVDISSGLNIILAKLIADKSVPALETVLNLANKASNGEKLQETDLEDWLDDENTDIEDVIEKTIEAVKTANATKLKVKALLEETK